MPQAKLIRAENTDKGIKLTFLNSDNKEVSGIYNNGNLREEDFTKLIGQQISFTGKEELDVHKTWDEKGTPTYCDDPMHGIDR